jgi:CBS domain-containing protein
MTAAVQNVTHLLLAAETAAHLMTANPVSIRAEAAVAEAIALLTDRRSSAAPVINEAGQPVGVVSRADVLIHEREQARLGGEGRPALDPCLVRDIMTPAVFSVSPETPAVKVIEQMVAMNVRQLFVVDQGDILIGVISAFDILQHMSPA